MQHYGVPTPFLDYSFDPFVSLFHAIDNIIYHASNNEIDNYFSLYVTHNDATILKLFKQVFDKYLKNDMSYNTMHKNEMSIILPNNNLYKIINSVNIINQKGLFLFNYHPSDPIEKTYKEFVSNLIKDKGKSIIDELNIHPELSACFNIHKSLIPLIRTKLKELGIDKNYIYPNLADLKESVIKGEI